MTTKPKREGFFEWFRAREFAIQDALSEVLWRVFLAVAFISVILGAAEILQAAWRWVH